MDWPADGEVSMPSVLPPLPPLPNALSGVELNDINNASMTWRPSRSLAGDVRGMMSAQDLCIELQESALADEVQSRRQSRSLVAPPVINKNRHPIGTDKRKKTQNGLAQAAGLVFGYVFVAVAVHELVSLPLRTVFAADWSSRTMLIEDLVADFVTLARIVHLLCTPFTSHGMLVTTPRLIARHQLATTSFYVYLIAAVPTGVLAWGLFDGSPYAQLNKMVLAPTLWYEWARTSNDRPLRASYGAYRCTKYVIPVLMIIHLFSCCWEIVLQGNLERSRPLTASTVSGLSSVHRWMLGCDWTIKHMSGYGSTGSFPQSDQQVLLMMVVAMIGSFTYATALAFVSAAVAERAKRNPRDRLMKKIDEVSDAMVNLGFSKSFREEIKSHYHYVFRMAGTVGMSDILDDLPNPLHAKVKIELSKSTLAKLPMFRGVDDPTVVDDLVDRLIPKVLLPGVTVVHRGEYGAECIFVVSGELNETDEHQVTVRYLTSGDRYGEQCLAQPAIRETNLTTTRLSTLFILTSADFQMCLLRHPGLLARLRRRHSLASWLTSWKTPFPVRKSEDNYEVTDEEMTARRDGQISHSAFSNRSSSFSSDEVCSTSTLMMELGDMQKLGSFLFQQSDTAAMAASRKHTSCRSSFSSNGSRTSRKRSLQDMSPRSDAACASPATGELQVASPRRKPARSPHNRARRNLSRGVSESGSRRDPSDVFERSIEDLLALKHAVQQPLLERVSESKSGSEEHYTEGSTSYRSEVVLVQLASAKLSTGSVHTESSYSGSRVGS
ncbi:Cyclic nucleotide-gated cation channel subunit A [Diplonema papillatum]|nr:Cyclic nucleotide-gated cation channel subunit A [Diplonema papillatum]